MEIKIQCDVVYLVSSIRCDNEAVTAYVSKWFSPKFYCKSHTKYRDGKHWKRVSIEECILLDVLQK